MKTITLEFSSSNIASRVASVIRSRQQPKSYNFDVNIADEIETIKQRKTELIITTRRDPYALAKKIQLMAHATAAVNIE